MSGDEGLRTDNTGHPPREADDLASSASTKNTNLDCASSKLTKLDESLSDILMGLPSTDSEMQDAGLDSGEPRSSSPVSSVLSSPPPSPLSVPEGFSQDSHNLGDFQVTSPALPSDTEDPQTLTPKKRKTPQKSPKKKSALVSPYFKPTPPTTPKKKRPPAGTVSCIPFPPLSSPSFGLIQEKLANDPFKLLIAVTFLNRTKGIHAIPVFYKLMHRYPTSSSLANASESEVADIVRHLGLQNIRAKRYVQLAKVWVKDPPVKGRRHRRLHYPRQGDGKDIKPGEILGDGDGRVGWEIAHLPTAGPYALDSWRIFCRDVLRGVARGWNGEGAEVPYAGLYTGEHSELVKEEAAVEVEEERKAFEPEWKRVVPLDKELRAFLRWMWLKEGWEWDPVTGEKKVASGELMERARRGVIVWEEENGVTKKEEEGDIDKGEMDDDEKDKVEDGDKVVKEEVEVEAGCDGKVECD